MEKHDDSVKSDSNAVLENEISHDASEKHDDSLKSDSNAVVAHELAHDEGASEDEVIIVTGADAAAHLLPLRDDGDAALTFRSLLLASILSCFQCVMYQIYTVSRSLHQLSNM